MAFPARPQPAAPTHASAHRIRRKSPLQSCRAIRRSLVHTNLYEQASPQADRGSRCNPASASPNPWRNPHSARGTAATHFPRFRALALFGRRPPERVVRPSSRRPKTCTRAEQDSRADGKKRPPVGGLQQSSFVSWFLAAFGELIRVLFLHRFLNLCFHSVEVEARPPLHGRILEGGLGQLPDLLLDEHEAPELV